MKHIGVDIGGSHITAAQVDLNAGKVIPSTVVRAKVYPHGNAEEILGTWAKTIAEACGEVIDCQLGIAMPGPFDYLTGICLMKNVNKYEALYGLNIKQELSERLGIDTQNIVFRNDSEAFLAGEMRFGAGKGLVRGIGITLGTGLGTSIYQNCEAQDMALGINYPMLEGVAEDYISTRWFVDTYRLKTQSSIEGVKQLVQLYPTDVIARELFEDFGQNLSSFIRGFIKQFEPEVIIIGGNIAQASEKFFPTIIQQLSANPTIQLRKAILNEEASLLGALSHK
ncbi:ROK family protein [Flectobacillus longus]|uniref:ROK family protein n=1 Tax=Flectobacillus longus TaxID=2984207 RepID=UPI0024B6D5D7|nr:ROK family protein [Flectobacillus longus]MDI9881544.1 ROK family protein [Flectobacillus longus]